MTKVTELKEENIESIRRCFYDRNIWTKNALSRTTGISLAGTTNVLHHLLDTGEIIQIYDAASTGGRKSKQYLLNRDHCHIACLILQKKKEAYVFHTQIRDLFGTCIYEEIKETEKGTLKDLENVISVLAEHTDISVLTISVPGVSFKGFIKICDFYDLEGKDIGELIRRYTDVPFVIENDVNVALIGFSKIYPDIRDMALLYQPAQDYFGCGILIAGKLYNGHSHSAGELRYLPDRSEEEQLKLLKEDPKGFLKDRIQVLQAVLDPEIIGWYSDVVMEDLEGENIQRIDDFYTLIQEGLYQIGLNRIKTGGK